VAVSDEQVAAATTAQAVMLEQASATLLELLLTLARAFTGWYSRPQIADMTSQAVTFVEAAQLQVAAATDAYLAQVGSATAGRPLGADEPTVLAHVENRARSLAGTDLQLAQREQEHRFMVVRRVDGWRRVIHPERVSSRSKDGTVGELCGLCAAASDRIYKRDELRALHAGCRCTVAVIINGQDPGLSLNRADLDEVYRLAGDTAAAKLKRVKFAIRDNSELGPLLRAAGDEFRGPDDVPDTDRAA
jgi:hypothetical protein